MINSSSCLAGVSFSSIALRKHWHIPFVSSFFSLERPLLFPLHLSCVGEAALWYVTRFTPSLIVAWEKVERNSFSLEQVLPWSSQQLWAGNNGGINVPGCKQQQPDLVVGFCLSWGLWDMQASMLRQTHVTSDPFLPCSDLGRVKPTGCSGQTVGLCWAPSKAELKSGTT